MDNSDVELVGGPCGQHGPYTFYKAFKYTKNGKKRLVSLSEFFFVKLWIDSDLLCIGELQLLWSDKNSEQVLASLRLYFLPENTPEGRMDHGEDEVLAISEKVVLRVEDLITWITVDAEWTWGRLAKCESDVKEPPKSDDNRNVIIGGGSLNDGSLDFSDVEKEKLSTEYDKENLGPLVVILSYPRYCRYRAMMRRLEGVENDYLKYNVVNALGGFTSCTQNTRVLFCKDTFDYPELEGHEMLCNHLAPKLKGRPRGKRKKRSVSPGSESNESESSVSNGVFNSSSKILQSDPKNGLRCDTHLRRSTRASENSNEEKDFLKELTTFMKTNYTPIGKIPSLGYKELNLFSFYTKVQKLGGYDSVTANRLWKSIFDDMSGHANSTSAATVIRRHYERFLLPYERHQKGEEYKPLPVSERRRLKSKTGSSTSDVETSESTSRSGNSTPVPQNNPGTPTTPENKDFSPCLKSENGGKPSSMSATSSSLRSVRVKTERQKECFSSGGCDSKNISSAVNSPSDTKVDIDTPSESAAATSDDEDASRTVCDNNPLTGVSSPMAGVGSPMTGVSSPMTGVGNQMTGVSSPMAGVGSPMTGVSSPMTGVGNQMTGMAGVKVELPVEKEPEPLTSAVAPRVHSPNIQSQCATQPEVKEETVISPIKTGETPAKPAEAPSYKTETADISNIQAPYLQEVKKRKLDILKEGGLEVTPVRSKDARPSVIQPTGAALKSAKQATNDMPPPAPPKKVTTAPSPAVPKQSFALNGSGPPKVLQSKSIYSYSERTVYGNPKDYMLPNYQVHTPKFVAAVNHRQQDILDLTVSSPQKPTLSTVASPQLNSSSGAPTTKPYKLPPQARRLGSNLEITLVESGRNNPGNHRYAAPAQPLPSYKPSNNRQYGQQKRHNSDMYANYKLANENGKYKPMLASTTAYDPKIDQTVPQYASRGSTGYVVKPEVTKVTSSQQLKTHYHPHHQPTPSPSPAFPYLAPQLYDNKNMPPYLPLLADPSIYYSAAMHSLYSHSATPPVLPFPTTEQLKFYTDLMAHNSRLNYGSNFQLENPNETNFKKP